METLSSPGSKVTIVDVANRAKVSPGTVSRVMNNTPNVDGEIRERVLSAVKSLGYVHIPKRRGGFGQEINPNPPAVSTPVKSIVMCVREMETPAPRNVYYSHVLHGAETECTRNAANMVYSSVKDQLASFSEIEAVVQRGQADGILLVGLNSQALIEKVAGLNLPVVLVNNQIEGLELDAVVCDFYQGTKIAMQHLVSLGHRDIVFVSGPHDDYPIQLRTEGYRISLIQHDLPYRPELIFESDMSIAGGERVGQQIIEQRLHQGLKFSAICCANDATAIGVIRSLQTAGIKVPEEVSVMGFDDVDAAVLISPPLSTIHTDIEALGIIAVERLIQRVVRPDRPFQHTVVGVNLIPRASTARLMHRE